MKERSEARGVSQPTRAIRERLSYANVMATAAMFVALGGSAWAVAANSVGTKQLKNNAVSAKKIKKDAVRAKHVRNNTIRTAKIRDGAVTAAKLADGVEGLEGPRGPAGPKGETGDQGLQGVPGAPSWSADCNTGLAANDVMIRVGSVCIDRYEASIWTARTGGTQITGAVPCNVNGQNCTNIYARSVAGVTPRADITWFQAQQALANSGKRLPTNAEWQMAVAGTPDSIACNVESISGVANTGANAGCISNHGANDMVGNLWEWVADWDEEANRCSNWDAGFGEDLTCMSRGTAGGFPGALARGGSYSSGTDAGRFAVNAGLRPSSSNVGFGFRGAR